MNEKGNDNKQLGVVSDYGMPEFPKEVETKDVSDHCIHGVPQSEEVKADEEEAEVPPKKDFTLVLPNIQVVSDKGKVLMNCMPQKTGPLQLKIIEDASKEVLVRIIKDLTEFHYRQIIKLQKSFYAAGASKEQIDRLFYPEIPNQEDQKAVQVDTADN